MIERNQFNILSISLLALSFIISEAQCQGTITGKIIDSKEKAYFFLPIQGRYYLPSNRVIQPETNSRFEIKVDSEVPGFLYLGYAKKFYMLYYTPKQRTTITLGKNGVPFFKGDNARENSFLASSLDRQDSQFPRFTDSLLKLKPDSAYLEWQRLLQKDLATIFEFCSTGVCDSFFKENLIKDQRYYYAVSFTYSLLRIAPRAFLQLAPPEMSSKDSIDVVKFWEHWGPTWEKVLLSINSKESQTYTLDYSNYLNIFYGWYLGYYKKYYKVSSYKDPSVYYTVVDDIKHLMTKTDKEVYLANRLQKGWSFGNLYFVPESIDLFDKFKKEFPTSVYLKYLEKMEAEVGKYIKKSGNNFVNKNILDKSDYTSLSELVKHEKGQVVYVDLWATWCKPCIDEFTYRGVLYDYISDKPVKLFYVSLDESKNENKWREMISKFDLRGSHIMASEELKNDIWVRIKGFGTEGAIPRYIILDKDGNLVEKDAPRPSDHQTLFSTLHKYIE